MLTLKKYFPEINFTWLCLNIHKKISQSFIKKTTSKQEKENALYSTQPFRTLFFTTYLFFLWNSMKQFFSLFRQSATLHLQQYMFGLPLQFGNLHRGLSPFSTILSQWPTPSFVMSALGIGFVAWPFLFFASCSVWRLLDTGSFQAVFVLVEQRICHLQFECLQLKLRFIWHSQSTCIPPVEKPWIYYHNIKKVEDKFMVVLVRPYVDSI